MRGRTDHVRSVIGVSKAIREILELVDNVARTDCCVLIEGESGTGKELIARRLHAHSRRGDKPLIPVNCAGVSEGLFESQFVGHVRGAFTGAQQETLGLVRAADGGTLFMDEVGEIPLHVQPKLLRVLQDGELLPVGSTVPVTTDTRFIAATNRSLREEMAAGRFRSDLFYRLNVVRIHLPPLRQRPEDIPPLLDHFLEAFARRYNRPKAHVGPRVRERLQGFAWPGNVRELVSWVARLYATGLSPSLLTDTLVREAAPATTDAAAPMDAMSLRDAERWAILQALRATDRHLQRAADILEIHRTTLWRKLKLHDIS